MTDTSKINGCTPASPCPKCGAKPRYADGTGFIEPICNHLFLASTPINRDYWNKECARLTYQGDKYRVIYADPPWYYNPRHGGTKFGSGAHKYTLMKTEAICRMPVAQMAAKECALFLWATMPKLPDALQVLHAWGFWYATVAFTWVKTTSGGGYHAGPGYYTASNAEIVLLGIKGQMRPKVPLVPSVVAQPRTVHSAKPPVVAERIERMYDGPYVELFARRQRPGWHCTGNQLDGVEL